MGKPVLVESDMKAGEHLLRMLDVAGIATLAAFWLYSSDSGEWRLTLATHDVDTLGPKATYKKLQEVLESAEQGTGLTLRDLCVVSPKDALVKVLRAAVQTGPDIQGIRLSDNIFDSVYIEDAYIYRMN